jgi:hypothetical protein
VKSSRLQGKVTKPEMVWRIFCSHEAIEGSSMEKGGGHAAKAQCTSQESPRLDRRRPRPAHAREPKLEGPCPALSSASASSEGSTSRRKAAGPRQGLLINWHDIWGLARGRQTRPG